MKTTRIAQFPLNKSLVNTAPPPPRHGTRCAGQVAAGKNMVCGVGVAYNAKVAGNRGYEIGYCPSPRPGPFISGNDKALRTDEYNLNDLRRFKDLNHHVTLSLTAYRFVPHLGKYPLVFSRIPKRHMFHDV